MNNVHAKASQCCEAFLSLSPDAAIRPATVIAPARNYSFCDAGGDSGGGAAR